MTEEHGERPAKKKKTDGGAKIPTRASLIPVFTITPFMMILHGV